MKSKLKKKAQETESETALEETFLDVDLLQLEKEWAKQPRLASKWYKRLARRKRELTQAEDEFELIEAQLKKLIRESPEDYGVRKPTVDAVEATVIMQDLYQEAKEKIREAQYQVDLVKATTTAIEHKKYALQDEVQLFLNDYYSEPSSRGQNREAVEEMQKREVANRGKRRRREEE